MSNFCFHNLDSHVKDCVVPMQKNDNYEIVHLIYSILYLIQKCNTHLYIRTRQRHPLGPSLRVIRGSNGILRSILYCLSLGATLNITKFFLH